MSARRFHAAELAAFGGDTDHGSYRLHGVSLPALLASTLAPNGEGERLATAAQSLADELHVLAKYVVADRGETDPAIFETVAESLETRLRVLAEMIRRSSEALDAAAREPARVSTVAPGESATVAAAPARPKRVARKAR